MKRNNKKGFTIVELVVVIAVIAILAAVLIPTFSGVTGKAKDAALKSDLRTAYAQYAAEKADDDGDVADVVYIKVDSKYYKVTNGDTNAAAATAADSISDKCINTTTYVGGTVTESFDADHPGTSGAVCPNCGVTIP